MCACENDHMLTILINDKIKIEQKREKTNKKII